ncbi:MAG: hypothetical protein QG603_480 [Patescibacteria group bacterium]|nr:hypothetical protein [Patescibacteria group bacterium]MDQ5970703.1 hypothetical protein [Patescibacteria group bacterium]
MLSIKKIGQKNIWLFALPVLLFVVIFIFFKFFATERSIDNKEDYLKVVRPRLESVIANPDRQHIKSTEDFLYNIKTSDRSIGEYHLPLYMAFSLWSKYTETRDLSTLSKTLGILEELKVSLPDLGQEIEELIEILKTNA